MNNIEDEFKKLKIATNEAIVALCELAAEKINSQQEENNELKAQVELLTNALDSIFVMEEEGYRFSSDDALAEIFNICREVETEPSRCLDDIRDNAINEFIRFVSDKHGNTLTLPRLGVCAQQLRGVSDEK